ncbi:hypothetical protein M878_07535 [Streptomyces roseochromogenus subsp. oscitans DS 12.976]|uniref:ATP-grasp domain-containing protein n=1 Tax=Streptomyces roseochromogenus subsp. oscitans DS 12.976 TaxID=1352936 RepID=V6KSR6_STRRC|nr:hypothetical protein M878_07535 [Streptomyces roseochromogenus subsp. oscitans DS 12.976]
MDHLGVEAEPTEAIRAATTRLGEAGLATAEENDTVCCYALQDKVWVHGTGQEPWEVYVVKADADTVEPAVASGCSPTPGRHVWTGGPATWNGRPVMVKPPFGGSSVGMSLVRDPADLPGALADAADDERAAVLVEEYVSGLPLTVGLLELPGGSAIVFPPLATEATEAEFYDADTKLDVDSKGTVTVRAAELAPDVLDKITADVRTLWDGIGLRGSARIDFILTEDGQPYVLEVNSTPGMSRDSNFAVGAAMVGLTHKAPTVTELLKLAVKHEVLTPGGALHAGIASLAADLGVLRSREWGRSRRGGRRRPRQAARSRGGRSRGPGDCLGGRQRHRCLLPRLRPPPR